MSLRPSASMPTTRRCRCWPRARPAPAGCGPMCATTGPSPAPIRRRRCSSTRPTAAASIPRRHLASYAGIDAGGCLCRLQPALRGRPQAGADHRGGLLGACAAQVLRAGRGIKQGADRDRSGRTHRCAVRHRARDQRPASRAARCAFATSAAGRCVDRRWRPGCASSAPGSPPRTRPPRRSTTASSAGPRSRASSTTDASACPTTPPSARCAPSRVGRHNWTFAGSDDGGRRAAAIYTLIETAKLNDIDPQAWLADVLARSARSSRQAHRRTAALELAPADRAAEAA